MPKTERDWRISNLRQAASEASPQTDKHRFLVILSLPKDDKKRAEWAVEREHLSWDCPFKKLYESIRREPEMKIRWLVTVVVVVLGAGFTIRSAAGDDVGGLHDDWDALLRAHVSHGRVDYKAVKGESAKLDAYLARLAVARPAAMSRDDQLAFWINAYNAFTVKLIVDHLPLTSIREISSPWKQERWTVEGRAYSLDWIEHKILREGFHEPRIHFAIVCASIGCPDLQAWAYRGDSIEAQLDRVTRQFMASAKHIKTATEGGWLGRKTYTLRTSKIFKWFGDDFTDGGKRSVVDFIRLYAPEAVAEFIVEAGPALTVKTLGYDWHLNALN